MTDTAKAAKAAYMKAWREKNADAVREYNKKWRNNNPDKVAEYQQRYWQKKAEALTID